MSNTKQIGNSVPDKTLSDVELHFVISDSIAILFASDQVKQLCGYSVDNFLIGSIQFQKLKCYI